jgi:hypothetical protein
MEGYLFKKNSGLIGKFKKRYFKIKTSHLVYAAR